MKPPRLVCLGQFTIDDVVRWDGTVRMACVGGDVVYSWFGAHLWIDEVDLVAPVGNDFPSTELDTLAQAGVNLEGISARDVPTMRSWALYEQDGRRTWVMRSDPSHFYELSPRRSDIPRSYFGASTFHIAAMDMAAQCEIVAAVRADDVLVALDPQEDYIAASSGLGASRWQTLCHVTLPLLLPGLAVGAGFAFIESFDNLALSIFVAGQRQETLPMRLFQLLITDIDPVVAAVSTVLIAASFLLLFLVTRLAGFRQLVSALGGPGRPV